MTTQTPPLVLHFVGPLRTDGPINRLSPRKRGCFYRQGFEGSDFHSPPENRERFGAHFPTSVGVLLKGKRARFGGLFLCPSLDPHAQAVLRLAAVHEPLHAAPVDVDPPAKLLARSGVVARVELLHERA